MSDLFGNHIVGFPTRRLIYWPYLLVAMAVSQSDIYSPPVFPLYQLTKSSVGGRTPRSRKMCPDNRKENNRTAQIKKKKT